MAHINICSIRNKLTEISEILVSDNLHILAVSETHLDATFEDSALLIQGYNIVRRDRNAFGGGVMFYVQEQIPMKIRNDLMPTEVEVLWLEIHLQHLKPMLIGCCYRPPSADNVYLDKICEMLEFISDSNYEIYFMGDMNINWSSVNCSMRKKLQSVTDVCGLSQIINKPTRTVIRNDGTVTSTCIDLIFTNETICSKSISIPVGCSDHNLVAMVRKIKIPKTGPRVIMRRAYKMFDQTKYRENVKNVCWSNVLLEPDPGKALNNFNDHFMPLVEKYAPLKKFTVRNISTPWIDNEIKKHMVECDQAKLTAIRSGYKSDWQVYRKLRNFVTKLNKKKKKLYYITKINNINNDSKTLWNILNNLMGKTIRPTPSFLELDGNFLTKPVEIANHLNKYFKRKIDNLRNNMLPIDNDLSYVSIKNKIMENKKCKFEFDTVSVMDVEIMLKKCKDKPAGVDDLDGKLLEPVADLIAPPICHIINQSLKEGLCPEKWKIAKITPLSKNVKLPLSGPNSRPISLLPVLSKIMERVVYDQIKFYFSANNLNTDYQHAYREGHSTATALTQMTDDWLKEIEQKNLVGAVLLDFTAAFDIIDHGILLKKLECYGFTESAILWMKSYLTNRKQQVYFNGSYSEVGEISCGVPQGSCLGPLLYTIFTNDLPLVLERASISMYADDSTIYVAALSPLELSRTLNPELQSVVEWIQKNKLVLNVSKTTSMVMGSHHTLQDQPVLNLCINKLSIQQVQETKLLGVILDNKLSWTKQINNTITKMGRAISIIKRCASFMPNSITKLLIQSLVLSNLDYCTVVWSNATMEKIIKLQKVQNRAARIALHCDFRTNVVIMHTCLGWLSVKKRLFYSLIVFFRNILITTKPSILYNTISFSSDRHHYSTRHVTRGNFTLPKARTNAIKRTVIYRAMQEWNALPVHITHENSKNTFKRLLKLYCERFNYFN